MCFGVSEVWIDIWWIPIWTLWQCILCVDVKLRLVVGVCRVGLWVCYGVCVWVTGCGGWCFGGAGGCLCVVGWVNGQLVLFVYAICIVCLCLIWPRKWTELLLEIKPLFNHLSDWKLSANHPTHHLHTHTHSQKIVWNNGTLLLLSLVILRNKNVPVDLFICSSESCCWQTKVKTLRMGTD